MTVLNDVQVEGEPRDAASVVLMRDDPADGLQVFLLKRGGSSTVLNDAYVFPGGRVDPEDGFDDALAALGPHLDAVALLGEAGLTRARAGALFVAACRETFEETGVTVRPPALQPLSRWITPRTPAMMRKRFDTRFFLAAIDREVHAIHDGEESVASVWLTPRTALRAYFDGDIALAPPQIMTLAGLARHASCDAAIAAARKRRPPLVQPESWVDTPGGARTIVYPGDERHSVRERALDGPTRLFWRNERFEPDGGFDAFFAA